MRCRFGVGKDTVLRVNNPPFEGSKPPFGGQEIRDNN